MDQTALVYSEDALRYRFSSSHPFNQKRLKVTYDLLEKMNAFTNNQVYQPRLATEEELELVHHHSFIDAVKKAGNNELSQEKAESFGLGTEDTPIFPHMHEASAFLVGGTLTATELVMSGKVKHAFHLGGGLHHGFKGRASGFCVYNDSSVAIKYIQQKYQAKVLYIDTDAHHGDGVQFTFYDDPSVCTFSIHETGRYLFPGTGNVNEWGVGKGYGTSFNIPLDAFTEDDSWLECFEQSVKEVAEFFKPDVILTQNGADAHFWDPLTHLCASMKIYHRIPAIAHELAHKYCDGKWIATGGGGYDIWRVVPRAWALIWMEMNGISPDEHPIPSNWMDSWSEEANVKLPSSWWDDPAIMKPVPRKLDIEEKNREMTKRALQPIKSRSGAK